MCLAVVLLFFASLIGEVASIVIVSGFVGGRVTLIALAIAVALGVLLLMGRAALTLRAAAAAVARGEPVGEAVAISAIGALAGVLLIIPGFLSDAIAVILLVPPMRARLAGKIVARLRARAQLAIAQARATAGVGAVRGGVRGDVIDADGVEIRDPAGPDDPASAPAEDPRDPRALR